MVLIRRSGVLGLLVLAGCAQSLFDARSVDIDDATCGNMCVADAADDFDGTAHGANTHNWRWSYLDDHRDRSWTAMNPSANLEMTSADTSNRITTCAAHPDEPACQALPRALLISTTGGDRQTDPAIELTAPASTVIQLNLHAFVPRGDAQTIRLYRNSREDVLFTGTATAGVGFQHTITLDALEDDRFLVAVEPEGKGATGIGLHLFVTAPIDTTFPSTCQLALPFETTTTPLGGTLASDTGDLCGNTTVTHYDYPSGKPAPSLLTRESGPFPDLGSAASIDQNRFLEGTRMLDWSRDVTLQLWVQLRTPPSSDPTRAWLFSDQDPDAGGGIGISIIPGIPEGGTDAILDVTACTDARPHPAKFGDVLIPYPNYASWHFVRVVRTDGDLHVCVDGIRIMPQAPFQADLPTGLTTSRSPDLGRINVMSMDAYFDGLIDDVRVFTGALPCDVP